MNLVYSIYLLFILTTSVLADKFEFNGEDFKLAACRYEIENLNISLCKPDDKYCTYCTNINMLTTLAGCLTYNNRNTTHLIKSHVKYCKKHHKIKLHPHWFDITIKIFNQEAKDLSEVKTSKQPINFPVRFSEKDMDDYLKSAYHFLENRDNSVWYGVFVFEFWILVLLFCAASHWIKKLLPETTKALIGPISNFYRKHISHPALYGKRKTQEMPGGIFFSGLIPTRFEFIVIGLFYAFIVSIHTIEIQAIPNDPIFGSKYMAELRYVADRTGIVATVMMPLLFLFAGRNNFLQWVCGLQYQTFLCYHLHLARLMLILIIVHSVNYTIIIVNGVGYSKAITKACLIWGVIATTLGGVMLIQSILYLRRNWYELFLLFHIVLASVFLVGTWVHISEFGYEEFLYPVFAVWVFDRVFRLCRLFYFGFPQVNVMLIADETIKLTIPKPKYWKVVPGGHAFLHFLKPTYFWQSHPFTFTNAVQDGEDNIVMYIKLKGGVTHSLYKLLNKSPGKMTTMRIGIEGPYGESTPAKYADKAVFIAGGNGIPGMYSEVVDIALHSSPHRKSVLKLIWVIRDYSSIQWFYPELKKLKHTNIETTIYVTRPNIKFSKISSFNLVGSCKDGSMKYYKSETEKKAYAIKDRSKKFKQALPYIHFEEGRPNIEQIVQNEIKESPGSISFVTCGHPVMVDEIRYQTCKNIDNPYKRRVDFYEQLQVWA